MAIRIAAPGNLRRRLYFGPACRVAVEAVGLNRWFVNACREAGLDVLVCDPRKLDLKKLGKKTDRRDAREIARRLWLGDLDRMARTYYPSDAEYGRRKLLRVRHRLVQMRQQTINQLRGMLNAYQIPGIGAQSAATLLAELGDVRRFAGPRAVAAYAGLVPRVNQSADQAHHGRLTKQGNPELPWILSQWAVRLMKDTALVRAWAQRLRRRAHKNKARMALARRLLVGLWVTLTRGEVFDLERCLGRA